MVLASGTRRGPYEILPSPRCGRNGRGVQARDTRLKPDVAIRTLPDAFVHDPERIARFQREAEALATLTHPNIGIIYDLRENACCTIQLVGS